MTDAGGRFGLTSRTISVGNQAPEVIVEFPGNGAFFDWGQAIPFKVTTSDAEDGTATDCARVTWTYGLGHDEHAHPEVSGTGCTGVFRTDPNSPEHGPGALLYGAVVVTYSDRGANGLPGRDGGGDRSPEPEGAAGRARHPPPGCRHLRRHRCLGRQRHPRSRSGRLPRLRPGELRRHRRSGRPCHRAGEVQLRWGAADAEPFATAKIPGGNGWKDVEISFDAPEGTGALYVTSADELAVDSLTMVGDGVGDVTPPTVAHTLAPATPHGCRRRLQRAGPLLGAGGRQRHARQRPVLA